MTKRVPSLLLALLLCIASFYALLFNANSINASWKTIAPWFGMPEELLDVDEVDSVYYFTITVTEQQRNKWLNMLQEQGAQLKLSDDGFELKSPIGLVDGPTILELFLLKDQIHEGDNRYHFHIVTAYYNTLQGYRELFRGGDYSVVSDDGKIARIEKDDGQSLSLETNDGRSFSVVTSDGQSFSVEAGGDGRHLLEKNPGGYSIAVEVGGGRYLIAKTAEGKSFSVDAADEHELLEAIDAYNRGLKPITTMLPVMYPELMPSEWWKIVKLVAILLLPLLTTTLLLFLIAPNCRTWHWLKFLFIVLIMVPCVFIMMIVMVILCKLTWNAIF